MAEKNKFSTRIKKKPMPESNTPPKQEVNIPPKQEVSAPLKKASPKSNVKKKAEKEITKRLTIDIPHTAYIAMKMHVLKESKTAKAYIRDLIMSDLGLLK